MVKPVEILAVFWVKGLPCPPQVSPAVYRVLVPVWLPGVAVAACEPSLRTWLWA